MARRRSFEQWRVQFLRNLNFQARVTPPLVGREGSFRSDGQGLLTGLQPLPTQLTQRCTIDMWPKDWSNETSLQNGVIAFGDACKAISAWNGQCDERAI